MTSSEDVRSPKLPTSRRVWWFVAVIVVAIPAISIAKCVGEASEYSHRATIEWNARLLRDEGTLRAGTPCSVVGRFSSNRRDVTGCLVIACERQILYDNCAATSVDLWEQRTTEGFQYRLRYTSPLRRPAGPHVVVHTPERRGHVAFRTDAEARERKYELEVEELSLPRQGDPLLDIAAASDASREGG